MKGLMNILKNTRRQEQSLFTKGGIFLGADGDKAYFNSDNTHTLILGATRSGKSRCIVLPTIGILGLAGESMIISDPKGELFQYTYPFLKRLGYDVYSIDFKNPERSDHINPLQNVIDYINRNDIPRAQKAAASITQSFVGDNTTGEKIWSEGEKAVIAACILAVVYDNKNYPEYQNLTNVFHFINNMCTMSDNPPLKRYIDDIRIKNPNHPALALISIANVAPTKTQGSFNISALATLRLFIDANMYNITKTSSFNIEEIGAKKTAVFMILPDEEKTYYNVAAVLTDQIYAKLVRNADLHGGVLKRRVNFILDEFGNYAVIPDFTAKMTAAAGRGIRFNLFLQSASQLESDEKHTKYGREGARTIMGNCEYWIFLSSDLETQKIISERIGDYTVMSNSRSNSYNGTRLLDITPGNVSSSSNLIGRRLLKPEELNNIERPEILVLGKRPAIMQAPDLSHTIFNRMFGMGDEEHNKRVREERYNRCVSEEISSDIALWRIWERYIKAAPMQRGYAGNILRNVESKHTSEKVNDGSKIFNQ